VPYGLCVVDAASDAPVTVLVTDIEGSTDLHTRLGDAAARELIRAHERVIREALAVHGGREIKTLGDGFLAAFTSTRRALDCAVAIQRTLTAEDAVRVRIGLHAGEVIDEGDDIFGAAVATAVRIMDQAAGGEILVSDLVRQLAGAAGLRFNARGQKRLKGLEGQWTLYEIDWRDAGETAPPAPAPSSTTLGRDVELTLLRTAVDDTMKGRGHLLLLAGEPGIGKTTLANEAAAYAAARGALVAWGACWEGEGSPAFWPWIQVIRTYAAALDDELLAADAGVAAAELCRLVPELQARLPDVLSPPQLDPEEARFRLFDAVASFLGRAAARQPLFFVLDDLHWSDESSMRLLAFVAAQLASNAIAIVGTYRDTEVVAGHPLAPLLHDATRRGQLVPVRGLDPADVAALMAAVASRADVHAALPAAVHRQTAGNPLFVGEVTRLLAAQNALDSGEVSVGVPQGVREVIERRMVRLPQRCIEMLTLGAVVGEEFSLDVVARAAGISVPALVELLEPALVADIARDAGTGDYRFAHALFREALYEGQGTVARAGLHLRAASALEQRNEECGDIAAAELAHHFVLAALTGESERAVRYARIAGQQATASLAYAEAVAHFERALHALDLAGQSTDSDRSELLLDLSGARWRAGDREGARVEVERAIALARHGGRGDVLARAALGLHRLGGTSGRDDNERLRLLNEANTALGDTESSLRAQVMAAIARETYHAWVSESRVGDVAATAVAMARRIGDEATLMATLAAEHDTLWFIGKANQRLAIATELERVARELGDREQAVEAILLQAVALLELGEAGALLRLEQFIAAAEALNNPRFAYLAVTRRAAAAMMRGDLTAAEDALDQAVDLASRHHEPDHHNVRGAQYFALCTLQGRRGASVAVQREAYLINGAFGAMVDLGECLRHLDEGDLEEARRAFDAIDRDETPYEQYGWAHERCVMAEVVAALGEREEIERLTAELEPYADQCIVVAGAVSFFGSVSHYLGLMAQAVGREDDAARYFADALVTHERVGAAAWVQRTRRAMAGGSGVAENELRRDGTSWSVVYLGAEFRVRDCKGLHDLATLLASPGTEVAAADLVARGEARDSGADDVLDDRARREFRRRLEELDGDLADAEAANDLERASRVRVERETLAHELAAALGLGGRSRKLGDPSERARKAVAARIRDAIERVAAEDAELGQHLRASINTGTFCSYAPPSPVTWRVTDFTAR
jgi:predicted ATPase/class 3 adenylate cyclase